MELSKHLELGFLLVKAGLTGKTSVSFTRPDF